MLKTRLTACSASMIWRKFMTDPDNPKEYTYAI